MPRGETLAGWIFITPALIGFCLFYLLPTIRAFAMGFTNWNLLSSAEFVGLDNYRRLITDGWFWQSIWVTFIYVLYNIPIQTGLSLLLAVLLDRFGRSVSARVGSASAKDVAGHAAEIRAYHGVGPQAAPAYPR